MGSVMPLGNFLPSLFFSRVAMGDFPLLKTRSLEVIHFSYIGLQTAAGRRQVLNDLVVKKKDPTQEFVFLFYRAA